MKSRFNSTRCLAALVMCFSGPAAHSASLYWDLNGTTANTAVPVTGAWDGTNAYWNTDSTGTGGAAQATNTATDDLVFSSGNTYTTGTITASGTRVAGSLTFEDNIATTLAGAITIGGGTKSGVFVLAGDNAATTVSGALTLATACIYQNNGTGTLTLSGTQGLGANSLTINGTGITTVSGVISGTKGIGATALTIGGTATVTLSSASNSFTGDIAISGAKLVYTGTTTTTTSQLGCGPGTAYKQVFLAGGAIFQVASADFNDNIPTAANKAAGVVFNIGAGGGTFDVAATRTLTLDDGTVAGTAIGTTSGAQLQGSGPMTKKGTGTMVLRNSQVFAGDIVVEEGTLQMTGASAFGITAAGTTIKTGAALNLNGQAMTDLEPITLTGTGLASAPAGVLTNSSGTAAAWSGPVTLGAGGATIGVTGAGALTLNATAPVATAGNTLTIRSTGAGRVFTDGVISGTGAVVVNIPTSTGDYVPRAAHTYTGGTTLTAGFTAVDFDSVGPAGAPTAGPFGTGTVTVGTAQLRSGTGGSRTVGNPLMLTGDPTFYTVTGEKSLNFSGPVALNGATRTLTSTIGTSVVGAAAIFNGNIGDSGGEFGIIKAGAGNITFNGTNTYGGNTSINAGSISIATTGALPGWNTNGRFSVASGATLVVQNGVSDGEITTLLGTTNFAAGANLGLDTAAGNRTLALNLTDTAQGSLGLTKVGANTLTLSGTNTYTGLTTVTAGTLAIASAASLPGWDTNGRYAIATGTSLVVQNGVTDANVTAMLGTTNIAAGVTLAVDTIAGDRTYTAAITNSAQGLLNLVKTGPNTLTLTGANTYTGTTTVNGGTLVAAGGSAAAGNIVVGNSIDNAVLNVPTGGTMTGGTITAGTTAGSFGAVNVTGGTLTLATQETTDGISFGAGEGGYGAFTMSGGTMTQSRLMFGGINGSVTGGTGVGLITGGTYNTNGWCILARAGTSATGILTVTGGTINHAGASQDIAIGLQGSGRAELNVAGGLIDNTGRRVTFSGGTGGTFHWTGTGLLNLNAGTLLTNSIAYDTNAGSASANSYVNFSGGTLKASSASAAFLPAFAPTPGINRVFVNGAFGTFAGGAVIDTNGFNNTMSANLLAPTGNGVTALAVTSPGSGYIGAPAVKILDDGLPSTATAYAVVGTDPNDVPTFGKVTSVVITNPGVIVGTATVNLVGGGGTGAAVAVTATGPNTSGGLTKTGVGTLTLTGANTYTGSTAVNAGTLTLAGTGTLAGTTNLWVSSGARFNYAPTTAGTLALGTGAMLTLANNSNIGEAFDSTIEATGPASVTGTVNLILSGTYVSGNTYTVLKATGGLDGASYNVLNRTDYTFTTTVTPTAVQITPTSTAPLTGAYWVGGLAGSPGIWSASNGTTASNWTTDGLGTATSLVPGAATDVFFSDSGAVAGNQVNMTLGADMAINSLTVNNPNAFSLLNTGGSTLTIGSTAGSGISVGADSASVTLNPNVTVANGQTWTNTSGNPLVLGGTVSNGANLLAIAGSGATTLANFSGGTGGLTVTAGTTTLTAATLTGAQTWTNISANALSVGSVNNGGFALTLAGTGDTAMAGVISGAGTLTKTGTGTAILSAANTHTGVTTVSAGTLTLSGNRTATATGGINVLNGTVNTNNGAYTTGATFVGSGELGAVGVFNQTGGTLTMSGNQLLIGNGGTGTAAGSNSTGTYNLSAGTVNPIASALGVVLGVNTGTTGNFNLSGTGNLNMPAGATLQICRSDNSAATNTTGKFTQTAGTATVGILQMGGSNTAPATANVGANATLNLSGGVFTAVTFTQLSGANTSTSTINISGTADVTLPAFPTARGTSSTATLNLDGGTLRPAAASATYMSGLTNAFIKAGGARIDVATGRNITITQALLTDTVSTGGGLTKDGVGVLSLAGVTTYTGITLVSGGTLQLGSATATGTLALSSPIVTNATFAVSRTNAVAQGTDFSASPITGAGGFAQAGAGTTTLNAANSFTGPTTLTAGVLSVATIANIGTASPLGAGDATSAATNTASLVFNGGTLAYTAATGATNRGFTMTGNGTFSFPAGNNNAFTFAGNVSGAGQFTLNGLAITGIQNLLSLTGDNSGLTGNVVVTVGGIRITNSNGLGTGTKTVTMTNGTNGNPRIELDGSAGDLALPATFTYTASNQTVNGCFVNLAGNNTIPGQINVTSGGGGLMATSMAGNLTLSANITATATLRGAFLQGAANGTVSGIISNGTTTEFFVQKAGAGTWTLSGENIYKGATTAGEGTLSASSINSVVGGIPSSNLGAPTTAATGTIALGGGSALAVNPTTTGTLRYTGSGETTDRVLNLAGTIGGGAVEQAGTGLLKFTSAMTATGAGSKTLTLKGSTAGTGEIAGAIVDNNIANPTAVEKSGTGTWTLSGPNTYTGATTVTGGTLTLTSAYLADSSSVSVASGATLNLNYTGTDIVTSLNLGGVIKANGIYDATNSGGLITGNGKIQVGSYAIWATANGIGGAPAGGDFDSDGLTNLMEYALGLDPKASNASPGTFDGSTLTFTKGAAAFGTGDVTYQIEQSTALTGWVVVVPNAPASPTISYTLPSGQPTEFARLKVTQVP